MPVTIIQHLILITFQTIDNYLEYSRGVSLVNCKHNCLVSWLRNNKNAQKDNKKFKQRTERQQSSNNTWEASIKMLWNKNDNAISQRCSLKFISVQVRLVNCALFFLLLLLFLYLICCLSEHSLSEDEMAFCPSPLKASYTVHSSQSDRRQPASGQWGLSHDPACFIQYNSREFQTVIDWLKLVQH